MPLAASDVREVVETDWSDAALNRTIADAAADVERALGPVASSVVEYVASGYRLHLRYPASEIQAVAGVEDLTDLMLVSRQYIVRMDGWWIGSGRLTEVTYLTDLKQETADRVTLDLGKLTLSYEGGIKQWADGSLSKTLVGNATSYQTERNWILYGPSRGRGVV